MAQPPVFTRDPVVEEYAREFLKMSVEDIKRMRLADLQEVVGEFSRRREATLMEPVSAPVNTDISPRQTQALTGSELRLLPAAPHRTQREGLCELATIEDDNLRGLEHLLTPLNVVSWCHEADGLSKLTQHIHRVLEVATELESAIKEKNAALTYHTAVLDPEDTEDIQISIQTDGRQLGVIFKWLQAVLDDIAQLIRQRLEVQSKLQHIRGGTGTKLCGKLHAKSLKLRALHSAITARCECLQIPQAR